MSLFATIDTDRVEELFEPEVLQNIGNSFLLFLKHFLEILTIGDFMGKNNTKFVRVILTKNVIKQI